MTAQSIAIAEKDFQTFKEELDRLAGNGAIQRVEVSDVVYEIAGKLTSEESPQATRAWVQFTRFYNTGSRADDYYYLTRENGAWRIAPWQPPPRSVTPTGVPIPIPTATPSPTPAVTRAPAVIPGATGVYLAFWSSDGKGVYAVTSFDFPLARLPRSGLGLYSIDVEKKTLGEPVPWANLEQLSLSPDGRTLVAGAVGEWAIINLETHKLETYIGLQKGGKWEIGDFGTKETKQLSAPFSAEDAKIVFLKEGGGLVFWVANVDGLWELDIAANRWRQLSSERVPRDVVLDPAGNTAAFAEGGGGVLRVLDLISGQSRSLLMPAGAKSIMQLTWSPDGQYLLYSAQVGNDPAGPEGWWNIYLSSRDGNTCKQLTDRQGAEIFSSISKNGVRIAYVLENPANVFTVFVLDLASLSTYEVSKGLPPAFSWRSQPVLNANGDAVAYATHEGVVVAWLLASPSTSPSISRLPDCR